MPRSVLVYRTWISKEYGFTQTYLAFWQARKESVQSRLTSVGTDYPGCPEVAEQVKSRFQRLLDAGHKHYYEVGALEGRLRGTIRWQHYNSPEYDGYCDPRYEDLGDSGSLEEMKKAIRFLEKIQGGTGFRTPEEAIEKFRAAGVVPVTFLQDEFVQVG